MERLEILGFKIQFLNSPGTQMCGAFLKQIYGLFPALKPRMVGTCFQNVVVELMDTIDISTLPGVIGGRVAFYIVGGRGA